MITSELIQICFLNNLVTTNNNPELWFPAATLALISQATHRQLDWARTKAIVENVDKVTSLPQEIVYDLARFCTYHVSSTAKWNLGDAQRAQVIFKAAKVTPKKLRFVELIRHTYEDFSQSEVRPMLNGERIDDFWQVWDAINNPITMVQIMSNSPTLDQVRTISMLSIANNAIYSAYQK